MDIKFNIFLSILFFLFVMGAGNWLGNGGLSLTLGAIFWALMVGMVLSEE